MKSISRRGLLRAAGIGLGASLISPFLGRLTSAAGGPSRVQQGPLHELLG